MKNKIGLFIIFNHNYEGNIEKLKNIYGKRFSYIRFIVPFYRGNHPDVISVYESSYYFQGYISQGYNKIFHEEITQYLFIGDDLILHPNLNEDNFCEMMMISPNDCYMESFIPLNKAPWIYWRFENAENAFTQRGCLWENELPPIEAALEMAHKYGLKDFELSKVKAIEKNPAVRLHQKMKRLKKPFTCKYPLVEGYSDFFVINQKYMPEFSRLCGVFAAMNLFVEVAIPTAMMLSCENIKMQKDIKLRTEKMGHHHECVTDFIRACDYKIDNMNENWPADYAYLHPVKLSKWN